MAISVDLNKQIRILNFRKLTLFDFFLLISEPGLSKSNQENDPGNVLSTAHLTIKYVHLTQTPVLKILSFCFYSIFRSRVRVAKNLSNRARFDRVREPCLERIFLGVYI